MFPKWNSRLRVCNLDYYSSEQGALHVRLPALSPRSMSITMLETARHSGTTLIFGSSDMRSCVNSESKAGLSSPLGECNLGLCGIDSSLTEEKSPEAKVTGRLRDSSASKHKGAQRNLGVVDRKASTYSAPGKVDRKYVSI